MIVLFDLDGTLTDSREGILHSARIALEALGLPQPSDERMQAILGPPLSDSFENILGVEPERVPEAIAHYRTYYREKGLFENRVYEGVYGMLGELKAAGLEMYLATSKPAVFAERILEKYKLDSYFVGVVGADLDPKGMNHKLDIVKEAMRRYGAEGSAVMVGDRIMDMGAAKELSLGSVFCAYGYGEPWEGEDADFVADSPADVAYYILEGSR